MMDMTRGERIQKRLDELKISAYRLADLMGVKPASVYDWLKSKGPKREKMKQLAEILKCRQEWLEFGTGLEKSEKEPDEPFPSDKYALIPRYEAKTSTGGGYHNGDHVEISKTHAFRIDWIKKNNWREEDLCVVEASGHSMEPQIRDGDVLLVNTADKMLQSGKVYVLLFPGEGLRAKRVHRMADGRIRISSDNPDKVQFPDEYYSPEEAAHLNIVGKVVQRAGEI